MGYQLQLAMLGDEGQPATLGDLVRAYGRRASANAAAAHVAQHPSDSAAPVEALAPTPPVHKAAKPMRA